MRLAIHHFRLALAFMLANLALIATPRDHSFRTQLDNTIDPFAWEAGVTTRQRARKRERQAA